MKTRAAVLLDQPSKWEVVEIDLDEPKDHEVLVRMMATGLCHSDEHIATGDTIMPHFPYCGGHEGAGIIEAVGAGVHGLQPGDHIVTSFIPSCGRCYWCARGMQNLCDNGALIASGIMLDGTYRMHLEGQDVAMSSLVGTFSELTVMPEWSCIKIPSHVSLRTAALLGCGVPTGWGSAVNAAQVRVGDVVIVMGVGGIGINAVQGAAHAGASRVIVADPGEFKRQTALRFGATDAFPSIDEAAEFARSLTNGQGADAAIITVGVLSSEFVGQAFNAIRKAGTVVVTSVAPTDVVSIAVNPLVLTFFQKRIQGSLYGMMSPAGDIPRLLALYEQGYLKLDELITRTYRLDEINTGYDDMYAGRNIRGLIEFA